MPSRLNESTPPQGVRGPVIRLRAIATLVWRCWPYYRPQLAHLITYVTLNILMGILLLAGAAVGNDLLNNKILLGEPVQPLQSWLLFVGDEYVATDAENQSLTVEQRRIVRNRLLIWTAIIAGLLMASFMGVHYYMTWIYQRINQRLRVTMLERAENLSLRYHDRARTGDAIYRVYQDSATITNILQSLILTPLRAVCWLLFAVVALAFFSPWLGALCLFLALPVVLLVRWYTPRIRARARRARETNSDLTSNIQETFAAIKVVKANAAEAVVLDGFDRDSHAAMDAAFRLRVDIVVMSASVALLLAVALLLGEYAMAGWVIAERATWLGGIAALVGFAVWNLGAFQSASGYVSQAGQQSLDLVQLWASAQDLAVGLERAFFLLDLQPGVIEAEHPVAFPNRVYAVSWRGVRFGYDVSGADVRPVLDGVDLIAPAGSVTAIVGATGAGKSTLVSLLLRLYDPNEGGVFVNDVDLRTLALGDLRSHVSIALQRNVLFATTVAENIGYAREGATRVEIERAAEVACADAFIRAMPSGYDTELGERGGKLSTGQRQRLSIARAIVRDTPILILDEPTASLDAATEHSVLRNLATWGRDRVVFLVTHRISTIRNAHQIGFLEDGRIVEIGDHATLMEKQNGCYRSFVAAESA